MKKLMVVFAAMSAMVVIAQEAPEGASATKPPRPMRVANSMNAMMGVESVLRAVRNPKLVEKLGLTEEQINKLKALMDEVKPDKSSYDKIRKGMDKQTELLQAEKIDEAAVMASIDEVFEVRKEMAKSQTKRIIAVRAVLTKEQIDKAYEVIKEFRGGMPGRGIRDNGGKGLRGGERRRGRELNGNSLEGSEPDKK